MPDDNVSRHGRNEPGEVAIDWEEIERWDRAYYLHNVQAQDSYVFTGVEYVEGNYLHLANGGKLLDFQSQLISDSLGHRHPRIHAEIQKAMGRYGHVFFGMATDYRARAAKLIIEDILGGEDGWAGRLRILSSGTEAVECAMTMARLYTGRPIVLTQVHSYHGMIPGATQLRGYRSNLTPSDDLNVVRDVPGFPGGGYMPIPAPEFPDWKSTGRLPSIEFTEQIIRATGPGNIAAIITEPMFGAGGYMPHPEYMPQIRDLCTKYDLLWIDDEVMCGFGRLGEWFAYDLYRDQRPGGIAPDLMAVGKGINGSALPVGGVVANKEVGEFFDRARWWSGSTHDAHPLVCASIVGALETMIEEDMISRVKTLGAYAADHLIRLEEKHPCVGLVTGDGLYYAVDLLDGNGAPIVSEDRFTAFTGDLSKQPNSIVSAECAARGVFLGGFVPNTIKVAPPFTITEAEIDTGMAAFDAALDAIDKAYC